MKRIPVLVIAVLVVVGLVRSDASAGRNVEPAQQFIDSLGKQVLTIMHRSDMTARERKAKLDRLLRAGVDLPRIGRFVLGRHWKSATPAQRAEYQTLFAEYALANYIRLLGMYDVAKFSVQSATSKRGSDTIVHSQIERDTGQLIDLRWRVREKGGEFRVIDLSAAGLSLAVTYRAEFSSVVASRGLNGLLDALRRRS